MTAEHLSEVNIAHHDAIAKADGVVPLWEDIVANIQAQVSSDGVWVPLKEIDIESMAAAVHIAYLDTCAKLGWPVKESNKVPYAELSDDSKELDRASVRAVLYRLTGSPSKEAEESGR